MSKIEVSKIEIRIGDKKIELSPEELIELKDVLEKTFPKEKTIYIPGSPIIIERPYVHPWKYWEPYWQYEPDKTTYILSTTSNTS